MKLFVSAVVLCALGTLLTFAYGAEPAKPVPTPPVQAAPAEKPQTVEDLIFAKGQLVERARQIKESAEQALVSIRDSSERGTNEVRARAEKQLAEIKEELDKFDAQITKLREKK